MRRRNSGFTLLELMTVILIVCILILVLFQSLGDFRARADFSRCMTNLRSLYVGASNYLQEQGHWPQIDPRLSIGGGKEYAEQWIAALAKHGITREVWVCPTTQRMMKFPELDKRENMRIDYMATPFDDKPRRPYQWSTQPWFAEKGSSHPGGNLVIFSDGQAMSLKDAVRRTYIPP